MVQGVESIPAKGIRQGILSDPLECSDTVARLVREVERALSVKIPKVLVALHGTHLKSYNAGASIPIPDPTIGISRKEVDRVITTCRTLSLDYDRRILHAFARGFSVDGQSGIKDPVGLFGTKLGVELHLVTGLNLAVQNVVRMLNRSGLEVEGIVLPALVASEAILSDLDRDLGVTLIRIGNFQTEILLFTDGNVRESFLMPWGMDHLSDGLSKALKLPRVAGEELLTQVRTLEAVSNSTVPLRVKAGSLARNFPQEQVVHWLASRVKEFLGRVHRRLDESSYFQESAAGIVMMGDLVRLEGFLEMAEGLLNMPVRLGVSREVEMESHISLSPSHATVIGLLRYGLKSRHSMNGTGVSGNGSPWSRWMEKTRRVLEEYF